MIFSKKKTKKLPVTITSTTFDVPNLTAGKEFKPYCEEFETYSDRYYAQKNRDDTDSLRKFGSGATRDTDKNKLDYEGFLSPIVIKRFGEYMNKHRIQSNGKLRNSDNWQQGIPKAEYMKSLLRHILDLWLEHRGFEGREEKEDSLCAIIFNAMGYLYEELKKGKINEMER